MQGLLARDHILGPLVRLQFSSANGFPVRKIKPIRLCNRLWQQPSKRSGLSKKALHECKTRMKRMTSFESHARHAAMLMYSPVIFCKMVRRPCSRILASQTPASSALWTACRACCSRACQASTSINEPVDLPTAELSRLTEPPVCRSTG